MLTILPMKMSRSVDKDLFKSIDKMAKKQRTT